MPPARRSSPVAPIVVLLLFMELFAVAAAHAAR
jgi:hypothetical protein